MYPEEATFHTNSSSTPNISSNTTSQISYTTLSNNPAITAHKRKLFTNKLLQKRSYNHGLSFNMNVLEEESIERKSFEEEWDSVIASAIDLVGHPTSEYSLDALLVGERPAVTKELKRLVATKHPLIETFNAYKSGGLDSSNFPALMTLLIGKAVAPPTSDARQQHSDILRSQRELAEIVEMLHFGQALHLQMMDIPDTNKPEPDKQVKFEKETLSPDETNVQKQILAAIISSSAENPIETTEKLNLTSIPTYSKVETHSRVSSVSATTENQNLTSVPSKKSSFSRSEQTDYQAPITESKTHLSATRISPTENPIKNNNSETNRTEYTANASGTITNSVENPTQLTGSIENLTDNPKKLSAENTYLTVNEFEANTAETKPTETITNGISFSNLVVTDNLESEGTSDVSKHDLYETGNKISILCGDYLIAHFFVAVAKLRSAKVFELMTVAIRDFTESSFVCAPEVTDSEGGLKLWTTRNTMAVGSLLAQGLQSSLVLAGHTDQNLMGLVKSLGIHIALACQAKQELNPFLDNATNHMTSNIDDNSRMNESHLEEDVDDRASANVSQLRQMSLPVLLHMDHTKDWDLWHDLANPQQHTQELMQQITDAEAGIIGSWQVLHHHRQEAEMLLQKIPHNEAQTILQAILQTLAYRLL